MAKDASIDLDWQVSGVLDPAQSQCSKGAAVSTEASEIHLVESSRRGQDAK